jgi:hypothetical protein
MHAGKKWISDADTADQRTKFILSSLTYSQNKNGAWQKENIFCRIFANLKSLIFITSFFATVVRTQRKAP